MGHGEEASEMGVAIPGVVFARVGRTAVEEAGLGRVPSAAVDWPVGTLLSDRTAMAGRNRSGL